MISLPSLSPMGRHRTEEGQRMGRRLAELRARKGLTQEQAADLLDVSHRTLQNWEAGENIPRGRNRDKLAKLYDLQSSDIVAAPVRRGDEQIQLRRIEMEVKRQGEMLDAIAEALGETQITELRQVVDGLAVVLEERLGFRSAQASQKEQTQAPDTRPATRRPAQVAMPAHSRGA